MATTNKPTQPTISELQARIRQLEEANAKLMVSRANGAFVYKLNPTPNEAVRKYLAPRDLAVLQVAKTVAAKEFITPSALAEALKTHERFAKVPAEKLVSRVRWYCRHLAETGFLLSVKKTEQAQAAAA